jgi:hypothetical protein
LEFDLCYGRKIYEKHKGIDMQDVKNYREKELSMYIISNVLVFLLIHGFIELNGEVLSSTKILSETFNTLVISAIVFGFILVVECLFTSGFKERLLYLFGFFHLPGCTIFSTIRDNNPDNRFSYQKLNKKYSMIYSNLPTENKQRLRYENEQWYSIYETSRCSCDLCLTARMATLPRYLYINTDDDPTVCNY